MVNVGGDKEGCFLLELQHGERQDDRVRELVDDAEEVGGGEFLV